MGLGEVRTEVKTLFRYILLYSWKKESIAQILWVCPTSLCMILYFCLNDLGVISCFKVFVCSLFFDICLFLDRSKFYFMFVL